MTQEQYQRAVNINDRLEELARVKKEIDVTTDHRLWYAEKILMEVATNWYPNG